MMARKPQLRQSFCNFGMEGEIADMIIHIKFCVSWFGVF